MNTLAYILAAGDSSWGEVIGFIILIGLAIIGSIVQKAKEKEQKTKSRKPEPSGRPQRQVPAPRTAQPARPVPPPVVPAAGKTIRVSEELRLHQQRQAQIEIERQKRLASRTSPEFDTNAIEARLVSVHPSVGDTAPGQIGKTGVILQLKTRDDAQKAIIMHEIFSPPKALRKGGDIWDS